MAYAPKAILDLYAKVHSYIPSAINSGVVGDANHSFGYHLGRDQLPGSDYSVQLAPDRLGDADAASALDISLNPTLMKVVTGRLLAAAKARDPRLHALREFCGTLDGRNTYPWDLSTGGSEGVNSWDSSHLWHVHLSFYREYANNYAALAPIADVIGGIEADMQLTDTFPNPNHATHPKYNATMSVESALQAVAVVEQLQIDQAAQLAAMSAKLDTILAAVKK